MERLNGWQRLWVLLSFLLGMGTVIVVFNTIETESHLTTWYKADQVIQEMEMENVKNRDAGIKPRSTYQQSSQTLAQVEKRIKDIDQRHIQDLKELPAKQFMHVAIWAGVWLGACVSLYVMGWLIGWVIRGFRPKAT